jgi:hypothetical protein
MRGMRMSDTIASNVSPAASKARAASPPTAVDTS